MKNNPLVRKLQAITRLSGEEEARIDSLCEDVHEFEAKQDIIQEGDRPEHVHLMVKGWAARYKMLANGSRQILAFLIPGDFCDIHVTILSEMDHGIAALSPCKIAYISADKMDGAMEESARLARALWWATLVDEAVLRAWIVNARRDAFAAVAHLLCEMHLRMRMVGLVEDGCFSLPLTQEELADATGLTAVHTNRVLQRMRAEKLITLERRMLTVLDAGELERVGDFDPNYLHIERRSG